MNDTNTFDKEKATNLKAHELSVEYGWNSSRIQITIDNKTELKIQILWVYWILNFF